MAIPFLDEGHLLVDLPVPGFIAELDSGSVGFVVINASGCVRRVWGLAERVKLLALGANLLDTPLQRLIESPEGGCLFLDRYRYFSSAIGCGEVALLVCAATEESEARAHSEVNARSAALFRRIGKALSMHGNLEELSISAAHEIASACELSAVLLWTRLPEDDRLTLLGRVGVNRQGSRALQELDPDASLSCAAEIVAAKRNALAIPNVSENVLTSQLEARFCFLPPKAMIALPLLVGDKLIGVLELIGRDDDQYFSSNHDLYKTLAEHLSLALNTAMSLESAEKLASFDPMTGVANHRTLQDFVVGQVSLAERNGAPLGLLMIDVDHFRAFNEEEGHDAGDWVLKRVAEKLRETLRPYDLAARYGGEEFTAVLPGLGMDQSFEVAERIRQAICSIEFTAANGSVRNVSVSIGVSCYPESAAQASNLFKAADLALFQAKRAGRNRCTRYDGSFAVKSDDDALTPWLEKWQSIEELAEARDLAVGFNQMVGPISVKLRLSLNQANILRSVLQVLPTYRRLSTGTGSDSLHQFLEAPEMRSLLPSLQAIHERFDGTGPIGLSGEKIPLLSRIAAVLMAVVEERGEPLVRDPQRFDPRIIEIVLDVCEAA